MIGLTDLDGTMVDSQNLAITEGTLPVMREFQEQVLSLPVTDGRMFCWKTGKPCTNQEFLDGIESYSMIEMLRHQNGLYGNRISDEVLFQWNRKEAGKVIEAFGKPGALKRISGAYEFLEGLRKSGVRMHAVSSSSTDRICVTLLSAGIAHLFDGLFSAQGDNGYYTNDDEGLLARVHSVASPHHYKVPLPKPHPAVYQLACWLTHVPAENTFTVEDSAAGAKSAKDAGIGFIVGLDTSNTHSAAQKLIDAGVDVVVPKLTSALPLIRARFNLPSGSGVEELRIPA